jgi:tetratricopeptide (TPR) repeat protein
MMPEPQPEPRAATSIPWDRTACALAILFGSLPLTARAVLGKWAFQEAAGVAVLCLVLAAYLRVRRKRLRALPDDAAVLEQAIRLASVGELEEGIALLTELLRRSPRLWQAYQYRGELRLFLPASAASAVEDFTQAIALAPTEIYLRALRAQAFQHLGDEASARADWEASGLPTPVPPQAGGATQTCEHPEPGT